MPDVRAWSILRIKPGFPVIKLATIHGAHRINLVIHHVNRRIAHVIPQYMRVQMQYVSSYN